MANQTTTMSEESKKDVVKKTCSVCHEAKPLDSFYTEKRTKDGKAALCKACNGKRARIWKAAHRNEINIAARKYVAATREHNLELKRQSQRRNPQTKINYQRKRNQLFPAKFKAYNAVQRAIKAGRIIRPTTCENCGEEKRLQAHHYDYSKPLDVKWLCRQCHAVAHHFPHELRIVIPPVIPPVPKGSEQ